MTSSPSTDGALLTSVRGLAEAAGFARVGVARADRLDPEAEQLDAWLAAGHQGEMIWMSKTAEVRKDPRHPGMLPEAQSVIVLVAPYPRNSDAAAPALSRVAKYALGRDYHRVLTKKARSIQRLLHERGYQARIAVDSKPVFERAWAERAGVGFVGKNCCLIVPGLGSHVFLACIVTTALLPSDDPMPRRCGSCRLCLDGCPTEAFEDARRLDARRCISYLTIEHRGTVDPSLRDGIGPWLFGCDVCQDVCPYNHTSDTQSMAEFSPHARWDDASLAGFVTMSADAFESWAQGSPVRRTGREGLAHNAALVLGNRGDRTHLRVLDDAHATDESAKVREVAGWAAARIRRRNRD